MVEGSPHPAAVAEWLRARVSTLDVRSVEPLAGDRDFDRYRVDVGWVVRVARTPAAARALRVELRVRRDAARLAPDTIRPVAFAGAGPPLFAGDAVVAGEVARADTLDPTQLAAAMRALHDLTPEAYVAGGLARHPSPLHNLARAVRAAGSALSAAHSRLEARLRRACEARLASLAIPPPPRRAPRVGHGALVAANLRVTPGGQLAAIDGWERIGIADPAVDFAAVCFSFGPTFMRAVLTHYGPDEELARRAELGATCVAVLQIARGRRAHAALSRLVESTEDP